MQPIQERARDRLERYGFQLDELPVTVLPAIGNPVSYLSGETPAEPPERTGHYLPVFDEIVVYERDFDHERERRINSAAHEGVHRYFTAESVSYPVPAETAALGEAMHTIVDAAAGDWGEQPAEAARLLDRTADTGIALYPLFAAEAEDRWAPLTTAARVALYDGDVTEQLADCDTFAAVSDTVDAVVPVEDETVEAYLEPVEQRLKEYAVFHPEHRVEAAAQFYTAYMYREAQEPHRRQHRYDVIDDAYDNADTIKQHLSDAFAHYDNAVGTDRERAIATFSYLRDQVTDAQRSATTPAQQ